MRLNNPNLKVHFEIESQKPSDMILTVDLLNYKSIPCHSIVLESPKSQVEFLIFLLRWISNNYFQLPIFEYKLSITGSSICHTRTRLMFRINDQSLCLQRIIQILSPQKFFKTNRRDHSQILQNMSESSHSGSFLSLKNISVLHWLNLSVMVIVHNNYKITTLFLYFYPWTNFLTLDINCRLRFTRNMFHI